MTQLLTPLALLLPRSRPTAKSILYIWYLRWQLWLIRVRARFWQGG